MNCHPLPESPSFCPCFLWGVEVTSRYFGRCARVLPAAPRRVRVHRSMHVGAVIAFGFLVGCGPGNELGRVPIAGSVSLDGQPLDRGSISFEPVGEGTSSGATITNGTFAIPEEKGLPPGKYKVRVFSAAGEAAAPEDQPPGESNVIQKERIPKSWNTSTEQEIEVKDTGEGEFKFDIKSS